MRRHGPAQPCSAQNIARDIVGFRAGNLARAGLRFDEDDVASVLLPDLTLVSSGHALPAAVEQKVLASFQFRFCFDDRGGPKAEGGDADSRGPPVAVS